MSTGTNWDEIWKNGVNPGDRWDANRTEPSFQAKLDAGFFQPLVDRAKSTGIRPRALVPGCGRGYSLVSLAVAGFAVVGLDLSTTALEETKKYIESQSETLKTAGLTPDSITLVAGNFFEVPSEEDGDKFDLIFDSTFLCALQPEMRDAWAKQNTNLLSSGGQLVLNVFPQGGSQDRVDPMISFDGKGPPFTLSTGLVEQILSQVTGEGAPLVKVLDEDVQEEQIARWGKETLVIYQKN